MECVTRVNMIYPIHDRAVIDIRATRIEHSVIADDIVAIHAISEANTMSSYLGIGKGKVVYGISISSLGIPNSDILTTFISTAYGETFSDCKTMTKCRS